MLDNINQLEVILLYECLSKLVTHYNLHIAPKLYHIPLLRWYLCKCKTLF